MLCRCQSGRPLCFIRTLLSPGRVSKASQDPENTKEPHGEHSREGAQRRRGGEERREKSRNGETSGREKRQRPRSPDQREGEKKKKTRQKPESWLHRDLQVRFIDKRYKGGKYYNCKVLVEDVLSPGSCVCRTENGHMLEDIRQDMLETVIPKQEGECVMVVLGEHRGQVSNYRGLGFSDFPVGCKCDGY
ncbi:hypothetical protein FKM82_026376 [Ascaphus truei]